LMMAENNGDDVARKILIVTERPEEYADVLEQLKDGKFEYEVVGEGSEARKKVESGEFGVVYIPDLAVGVNGSCSKTNYFQRFFRDFPSEVDSKERALMNEGLSVLMAAERKKIPTYYSDEFNYCMDPPDRADYISPKNLRRALDLLVWQVSGDNSGN